MIVCNCQENVSSPGAKEGGGGAKEVSGSVGVNAYGNVVLLLEVAQLTRTEEGLTGLANTGVKYVNAHSLSSQLLILSIHLLDVLLDLFPPPTTKVLKSRRLHFRNLNSPE